MRSKIEIQAERKRKKQRNLKENIQRENDNLTQEF